MPIPGARRIGHLEENVAAAGLRLGEADAAAIGAIFGGGEVLGERYTQGDFDLIER